MGCAGEKGRGGGGGGSHLPVPSFSTASTSASTSGTEKGLLVLRCESSERFVFWFRGTIASASAIIVVTGTKALETEITVPSLDASVRQGIDSFLLSIWLSNLVNRGGSQVILDTRESKMGRAGDLEIRKNLVKHNLYTHNAIFNT